MTNVKQKLYLIIIVFICGLGLNIQVWAQNKTILVIGDSISSAYGMKLERGWVSLLQDKLTEQGFDYEVVNASITGDVTASGRERIGKHLFEHLPKIVIIELGGNDGLRGLPITQLRQNLQSMIDQSIARGAKVVLAGMQILPNYGPRYTNDFAQTYPDLAEQNDIALVPFILDGIGGVPGMMQADGIHPNEQAQPVIVDNIWPHLNEIL